jgi:acyl carrier protein
MTYDDVLGQTRSYVQENFLYMRRDLALENTTPLLEAGVLESMGVMELIQFVEETFSIEVRDEDVTEENLGTLQAIASYVMSRADSALRQSA